MKIVLQDLTKIFPSRNKKSTDEVVAVDHFNFEIPDGKLIGLLGPNGAGKTTTIRHILGFIKPQEGRAEVDGLDCWRCPDHSAYAP